MTRRLPIPSWALGLLMVVVAPYSLLSPPARAAGTRAIVIRISDGDTINVKRAGKTYRIRFAQIDAPEISHFGKPAECWGREATLGLKFQIPVGTTVRLTRDADGDNTDRYGRYVRYVWRGSKLVQSLQLRNGEANPYFYKHFKGRYAARLLADRAFAQRHNAGAWQFCPGASTDVYHSWDTGQVKPHTRSVKAVVQVTSPAIHHAIRFAATGIARPKVTCEAGGVCRISAVPVTVNLLVRCPTATISKRSVKSAPGRVTAVVVLPASRPTCFATARVRAKTTVRVKLRWRYER